MNRDRVRALICAAAAIVSLHGCVREALVGDNTDGGLNGQAGAPTIHGVLDQEGGPTRFDATPARVVSPTWRYDFACDGLCARTPDVEVSSDGTVWGALLGGPGLSPASASLVFVRLDPDDGSELGLYSHPLETLESGTPLLLDAQGRPYVLRFTTISNERPFPANRYRLEDEELRMHALPPGLLKEDTTWLAAFPDGSLLEVSTNDETRAARFSAAGEQLWQTKDLRAEPVRSGGVRAIDSPLILSDGSVVLDELQKVDPLTGLGVEKGLTVLGPDGKVRWDMQYWLSAWPFKKLAAGLDGALLVAGMNALDGDLGIYLHDSRGTVVRSFRGARVGYHAIAPRALAVDENGDIYVALVVGERNQPKLSVCKLVVGIEESLSTRAQDPGSQASAREQTVDLPAACVALDFVASEHSENATIYPFLYINMTVAEPGAVLLALAHQVGNDVITSIVRLDVESDSSTRLPAP